MRVIGVDPGKQGALALLDDGEVVDIVDMPMIDKRVNVAALADWVNEHHRIAPLSKVVIERVHAMPGNGSVSMFNFGRSYGELCATVITLGHVVEFVPPTVWKKSMQLTGKDKSASRQVATDMFPSWAQSFKRVKDDGRAEAVLIAVWGGRREGSGSDRHL